MHRMSIRAGLSFLEGPDTDNSVSRLILFNNICVLLYKS